VWGRVTRGYACALGLVLSVGCGGSSESKEELQAPPDPAPSLPDGSGADAGSGAPDSGSVIVEPPPDAGSEGDAGTPPGPDAGTPGGNDGGTDAGTPGGNDGGTDAGTPGGNDGGTSTPDAGVPPVTGGPAERGKQWRASYYAGVSPGGLAVGDFNGDGAQDVVVNDLGAGFFSRYKARPGSFVMLLNDGKGALQKPAWRRELHSSSGRIVAGDADANGTLDLVVGTRFGAFLLMGSGDGTFSATSVFVSHGLITHLGFWSGKDHDAAHVWATGDWDGPSGGRTTDGGFYVLVPTPGGGHESRRVTGADGWPIINLLDSGIAAAVADFNEDGRMDVVLSTDHRNLTRFLGTEAGLYADWAMTARRPNFLAAADLNGDGHADLVEVNGRELWTHLGHGNGEFADGVMTSLPDIPSRLVVADVDADQRPDVVLPYRGNDRVSLWRGNGVGTFHAPQWIATGREPTDAAVADLDRDGTPELLVTEAGDNAVSVYTVPRAPLDEAPLTPHCPLGLKDGEAGGPGPEPLLSQNFGVGTDVVTVGDFDGNGHQDLALRRTDKGVQLLLTQADGTFVPRPVLQDRAVHDLAAGDFNGDGRTDLALLAETVYVSPPRLELWWNDGTGNFPERSDVNAFTEYGGYIAAADVNGDGRMDLVTALRGPCAPRGAVWVNEGGGVLRPEGLTDHNWEPDDQCGYNERPTVADFNGDGMLDVLHHTMAFNLNYLTAEGQVRPGEGFVFPYTPPGPGAGAFSVAASHVARSAADVDGDGAMDLVFGYQDVLNVVRGDGGGTLMKPLACTLKTVGKVPLAAEDVNGDGVVDLMGLDAVGTVFVVLGKGGGTYHPVRRYPLEARPLWAAPVNVRGDAKPELVVLLESGALKVFPTPAP
jgi:hypothetical protein